MARQENLMAEQHRFIDRSGWPSGPWDDEPDRLYWVDEATGLPCLIRRGPSGALCGYVAVLPDHPWHGRSYHNCILPEPCGESYCGHSPDMAIDVHGGLTYADSCDGDNEKGICHVSEPGQPDDAWWFGFDCGHSNDVLPAYEWSYYGVPSRTYRQLPYVRDRVQALARQLADVMGSAEVSHA
jgi:hypothetical protein